MQGVNKEILDCEIEVHLQNRQCAHKLPKYKGGYDPGSVVLLDKLLVQIVNDNYYPKSELYKCNHHHEYAAQGQVPHCKLRNQGCSSAQRQIFHRKFRNQAAVLLGMDRCGSFPLLSAPHSLSLASEQTLKDLRRSQGYQRGGDESGFG